MSRPDDGEEQRMDIRVEWHVPPVRGREYAEWYRRDYWGTKVCTVTFSRYGTETTVVVYAEGDVRFMVTTASGLRVTVRSTDELAQWGITDDASMDSAHEADLLEYDGSTWFDFYDADGEPLHDGLVHTLTDALECAVAYVMNPATFTSKSEEQV